MITLLLYIYFGAKAWKRGWGAWVFAPIVCGYLLIFMLSFLVAAGGGDELSVLLPAVLIDVGIVVCLGIMARRDRRNAAKSQVQEKIFAELA